jgi:cation:H+ antiporter
VLLGCYAGYLWAASKGELREPSLEEGPAEEIGRLSVRMRRTVMGFFFLSAGYTIYVSAPHFAEGLVRAGRQWGIEEFLLVQWVAPLASEAPEFIVALLFALHRKPELGLGALVSSKVNQWTLLVGMLPLVYCLSLGRAAAMPLDARQVEEILLTAAQSLFGICVLVNFDFTIKESLVLAGLFLSQFLFPGEHIRYALSAVYLLGAAGMLIFNPRTRRSLGHLWGYVRETTAG